MRASRSLVLLAALLTSSLTIIGTAGVAVGWTGWGGFVGSYAYPELVLGLSWSPVGLVLAARRPRNPVGWVILLFGLSVLVDRAATALGELASPAGLMVALVMALQLLPFPPLTVLPALTLVLFPDGRPPSRHWWWVLAPLLALAAIASAGMRWVPDAELFLTMWERAETAGGLLLLAGVAGLVARHRRADPVLRQQVRGVLFAMSVAVAVVLVFVLLERPWLGNPALALVPVSIGAAVVRYRLFDLDRLVSRTVAYSLVVALLAGMYLVLVVAFGGVALAVTGESGDLVVALSTLSVAALFNPVRQWVQRLVDRRFNRARYDAARTVEAFGRGVREHVGLEQVVADLRSAAGAAVQPAGLAVHLVPRTGTRGRQS